MSASSVPIAIRDDEEQERTEALTEIQDALADKQTLKQQLRDLKEQLAKPLVGLEAVDQDAVDVEDVAMFAKSEDDEGEAGSGAFGPAGDAEVGRKTPTTGR